MHVPLRRQSPPIPGTKAKKQRMKHSVCSRQEELCTDVEGSEDVVKLVASKNSRAESEERL